MVNKLQWDKPYDTIDILSQLQKLGENSFNPINLRKNDQTQKKHKNKKAQMIIEQSIKNEIIYKENDDNKIYQVIINKLLMKDIDIKTILKILSNIKTKKYKIKLLYEIGKNVLNTTQNKEIIFHIYISLKLEELNDTEINNFLKECEDLLEDIIKLQMNDFSEYIYPKDLFNTNLPTLDEWQKNLLNNIDNKKNILLIAPTSAGKTNLAVHVVEVSNKVLFVVPTDAVARQVAGMLLNLKYSTALITSREYIVQNNNYRVLVGTPIELENYIISEPNIKFSYIICDEIHHIGANECTSSSFERLLKAINCNILAMSATVGNPQEIQKWLEKVHKTKFVFINHTKRFINQQKHLFIKNGIKTLHPLSIIDKDFLLKYGFTNSITFTAKDLYKLYMISELECFSPYNFFKKNIIKMENLLEFEDYCKNKILELVNTNNCSFLDKFKIDNDKISLDNYLDIIKTTYEKKMYPSLIFTNSYKDCMESYKKIIDFLEKEEEKKYPYYKENNLLRHEHYQTYIKECHKLLQKVEIPKNCTNPQDYLEQIKINITDTFVESLHNKFKVLTINRIKKIEENTSLLQNQKELLINSCNKDLAEILKVENMEYIDPYRPHPEFTFTTSITSDKMRKLKKRLSNALDINIDYSHTFLRGLERGIIVYHSQLQTPFQNEIQTLIIQKEVNFIIADESLGAGINMPIKTVVLLGNDLSEWDFNKAQQMCGRSGRRGIDREGHIIYAGSNWKKVILNPSININGADIISSIIKLPEFIYPNVNKNYIDNCFKITLKEFISNKMSRESIIKDYRHKSLIWNIRYIDNCELFDTIFEEIYDIEKSYDLCNTIITKVVGKNDDIIYKCLKENIININDDPLIPFKLRLIGIILIKMYDYII